LSSIEAAVAKLELGVLVSGTGSNLLAILDAIAQGTLDARVRIVISNVPDALALQRAANARVPVATIVHGQFSNRQDFDAAVADALTRAGAEWVVLAGFMRVLTPEFLRKFRRRVLNIHPALLPSFPGVHAQQQAFDYGVKVAGCTVHFVDEGVDSGPIIAQRAVPVLHDDSAQSLAERVLEQEHLLFVDVLRWLAADRIRWQNAEPGGRPKIVVLPA
jgi:phosphoribosylglycinamide formyltransferase 1